MCCIAIVVMDQTFLANVFKCTTTAPLWLNFVSLTIWFLTPRRRLNATQPKQNPDSWKRARAKRIS